MPFDTLSADGLTQVVAYVCTDEGAALAQSVVDQTGGAASAVHGGGLSGAARLSESMPQTGMLLAEIGNIPIEMACDCVQEICTTGAQVIVIGEQTDLESYRALKKAGAVDYFPLNVSVEDILAARPDVPMPAQPAPHRPNAPVIAVMGSNGGVGASLLAQNLASHAASAKGANERTALLDADLMLGTQAIDLDRDQTTGLLEALKAPQRIDATFISATMDHLNDNLSLYSTQLHDGQNLDAYEAGLVAAIDPLRREVAALVIDLPRLTLLRQTELAGSLDTLVLVIPAGFAGVNAAARLIERARAQNPKLRILPVLSELRRDANLSAKDVTKTIALPLAGTLPASGVALARAQRAAKPLICSQPRGAYAKAVRSIWSQASADPAENRSPKNRSFLRRIFK